MPSVIDILSGPNYPENVLSNFYIDPFIFRGVLCNSLEGILQGLKFEDVFLQKLTCTYSGYRAKNAGKRRNSTWQRSRNLWWDGVAVNRDSPEYQELLNYIFDAAFLQSSARQRALIYSGDSTLIHTIGRNNPQYSILTQDEFCSRLVNLRKHFQMSLSSGQPTRSIMKRL